MRSANRSLWVMICACWAGAAHAQDAPDGPPSTPTWTVDVGAAAIAVLRYPGSDRLRLIPVPDVKITYKDLAFASFETGVGINLVRLPSLKAGLLARPDFGRTQRDVHRYLPVLSRIGFAPELGGFAELSLSRAVSLRGEVRQAIGGHDGLVGDLSASYTQPIGRLTLVSIGPALKFGDGRYERRYFEITPTEALASGLSAYRPEGGLVSTGVRATLVQSLAPRLSGVVSASYDRLLGDAARSPIVRAAGGSPNQPSVVISLRYSLVGGR